jgi:hypothetical protein
MTKPPVAATGEKSALARVWPQEYQGLSHSAQGKSVDNQYLMMAAAGKFLIFLQLLTHGYTEQIYLS